jgi:hypothetical protein
MSQNQIITLLIIVLLIIIGGSIALLISTSDNDDQLLPPSFSPTTTTSGQRLFNVDILEQQAYQLLNKQLVREGALPVPPPAVVGKANPFI